jgi:hypothetical protein
MTDISSTVPATALATEEKSSDKPTLVEGLYDGNLRLITDFSKDRSVSIKECDNYLLKDTTVEIIDGCLKITTPAKKTSTIDKVCDTMYKNILNEISFRKQDAEQLGKDMAKKMEEITEDNAEEIGKEIAELGAMRSKHMTDIKKLSLYDVDVSYQKKETTESIVLQPNILTYIPFIKKCYIFIDDTYVAAKIEVSVVETEHKINLTEWKNGPKFTDENDFTNWIWSLTNNKLIKLIGRKEAHEMDMHRVYEPDSKLPTSSINKKSLTILEDTYKEWIKMKNLVFSYCNEFQKVPTTKTKYKKHNIGNWFYFNVRHSTNCIYKYEALIKNEYVKQHFADQLTV